MRNRLLTALLILGSFAARAEDVQKENRDLTIEVPQTRLQLEDVLQEPKKDTLTWEITDSSWSPGNLSSGSYLNNTGSFSNTTFPKLSVNMITSGWANDRLKLAPKFGLSYNQLQRSGQMNLEGQEQGAQQTMSLYSVRAGLEVSPANYLLKYLKPTAAVSILPTLAQAPQTELSDGVNKLYTAFEESVGLGINIPPLASWIGAQSFSAEIGYEMTQGIGSDFTGNGVLAGARIEL